MSNSSQGTRKNGCAFSECITDPCPKLRPPKSRESFCIYFNDGKKRSAIKKERVGGKQT